MSKINKQNIGNAGEYYIAARLSALNFIVTLTLGRAEKYDIIAISPSDRAIRISVKTGFLENLSGFPLSSKDESSGSDDFFYAFVKLKEFKTEPDFWIIPSKRVNEILKFNSHLYFKVRTRKDGAPHKDGGIRKLRIKFSDKNRGYFPKNLEKELNTYNQNLTQLL